MGGLIIFFKELFSKLISGSSSSARADFESVNKVSIEMLTKATDRLDRLEKESDDCREDRLKLFDKVFKLENKLSKLVEPERKEDVEKEE